MFCYFIMLKAVSDIFHDNSIKPAIMRLDFSTFGAQFTTSSHSVRSILSSKQGTVTQYCLEFGTPSNNKTNSPPPPLPSPYRVVWVSPRTFLRNQTGNRNYIGFMLAHMKPTLGNRITFIRIFMLGCITDSGASRRIIQ